jgi:hypothetical protein
VSLLNGEIVSSQDPDRHRREAILAGVRPEIIKLVKLLKVILFSMSLISYWSR